MSTSESPCHLSGSGRNALASNWNPVTFTDSSPLRVAITVPSTPIQSPRSSSSNAPCSSSPSTARLTKSCTAPSWSLMVAKVSLPWRRSNMMRPATRTATSVSVPASSAPNSARSSVSVRSRSKRTGYGSTPARRSASTSARRRARSAGASGSSGASPASGASGTEGSSSGIRVIVGARPPTPGHRFPDPGIGCRRVRFFPSRPTPVAPRSPGGPSWKPSSSRPPAPRSAGP